MVVVTPSKSDGHLALRRWMKRTGNVVADLARSTGFSDVIVGKVVRCVRAPGPHLAPVLVDVTGIPLEAWYPEAKIDPLTVEVPDGKNRAGRPRKSEGEGGRSRDEVHVAAVALAKRGMRLARRGLRRRTKRHGKSTGTR